MHIVSNPSNGRQKRYNSSRELHARGCTKWKRSSYKKW